MADLKAAVNPLFLREEELRQGIDLLFFVRRDLGAVTDEALAAEGLGRAHHRALMALARRPRLAVGDLLALLRVRKQSLARVVKELQAQGLVQQSRGTADRRQRMLELTERGRALEESLAAAQRARLAQAYREAGAEAVEGFRTVMLGLIDPADRKRLAEAFAQERQAMARAGSPVPGRMPRRG